MKGRDDSEPELIEVFTSGSDSAAVESSEFDVPRPGWRRWRLVAGAAALTLVVAFVVFVVHRSGSSSRVGQPRARSSSPGPTGAAGTTDADPTSAAAVRVTRLGRPLFGAKGTWELFGRGADSVVRIQPARGTVTVTAMPPLASTGRVSFVALRHGVVVRPWDSVPGYIVSDGGSGGPATGALSRGPILPGSKPGRIWFSFPDRESTLPGARDMVEGDLERPSGHQSGPVVFLPAGAYAFVDGLGHLMYMSADGALYRVGPTGDPRRVSTGSSLLAAGAGRVLTCKPRTSSNRCSTVLIDTGSGRSRVLPARAPPVGFGPFGAISPDGRTAALPIDGSGSGVYLLHLLDLESGVERSTKAPINPDADIVWSPDSRWAFAVAPTGDLIALDARTHTVHAMGVKLPALLQLTIRGELTG